jgi:hypothetical protein
MKINVLPALHAMFMIYRELTVILDCGSAGQWQTPAVLAVG